jgi:predicted DNA-binding transcriptional regulator AlpA
VGEAHFVAAIQLNKQSIAPVNHLIEPLLSEREVAAIFGLSLTAIRRWRLLKRGPRYIKIGVAVRYRLEDIRGWLATRPSGGELASETGR